MRIRPRRRASASAAPSSARATPCRLNSGAVASASTYSASRGDSGIARCMRYTNGEQPRPAQQRRTAQAEPHVGASARGALPVRVAADHAGGPAVDLGDAHDLGAAAVAGAVERLGDQLAAPARGRPRSGRGAPGSPRTAAARASPPHRREPAARGRRPRSRSRRGEHVGDRLARRRPPSRRGSLSTVCRSGPHRRSRAHDLHDLLRPGGRIRPPRPAGRPRA